jgi:general secretion pathway protein B
MSYILEALKKAQAERASGTVPDVHAQPLVPPVTDVATRRSVLLTGAAALAGISAALAAAWFLLAHDAPAPAVRLAGGGAAPVPTQVEAPAASSAATSGSAAMANTGSSADSAASARPRPAEPRPSTPEPVPAPGPAPAAKASQPSLAKAAPAVPKAAPAEKPEPIVALQDLPPQIQREIPTLAINGYIYASNPAERSVLINNQLRREGQQVAPGLTLEKLLPKEMVLNYRGYRYRIAY